MKHYQFVSFGEHGFQTHRFEIQDETEEQLLELALQFCEQESWTLIAGTVLGGEDPLPGLKASLGRAARDLDIEIGSNDAVEVLAGISLLELTEKQLYGLKEGIAFAPDGSVCANQEVLVVQMLPVWWNTDGRRTAVNDDGTTRDIHIQMWDGYEESDNPVGPQWLEFGGRAYRIPDELVVEHVG